MMESDPANLARQDIEALVERLPPEDRKALRAMAEGELIRLHWGYGMGLRNQFRPGQIFASFQVLLRTGAARTLLPRHRFHCGYSRDLAPPAGPRRMRSVELVECDHELQVLTATLGEAVAGARRIALISGEAGTFHRD
jgi:hypothetical protein